MPLGVQLPSFRGFRVPLPLLMCLLSMCLTVLSLAYVPLVDVSGRPSSCVRSRPTLTELFLSHQVRHHVIHVILISAYSLLPCFLVTALLPLSEALVVHICW